MRRKAGGEFNIARPVRRGYSFEATRRVSRGGSARILCESPEVFSDTRHQCFPHFRSAYLNEAHFPRVLIECDALCKLCRKTLTYWAGVSVGWGWHTRRRQSFPIDDQGTARVVTHRETRLLLPETRRNADRLREYEVTRRRKQVRLE